MKSSLAKQLIISDIFEMNVAFIQFSEDRIDMPARKLCLAFIEEEVKIKGEHNFNNFLGTLYLFTKSKKYLIPYGNKEDNSAKWLTMNIDNKDVRLEKLND